MTAAELERVPYRDLLHEMSRAAEDYAVKAVRWSHDPTLAERQSEARAAETWLNQCVEETRRRSTLANPIVESLIERFGS